MKRLNKKGFTLVELLAVIVILALLMIVATRTIGTALTNSKTKAMQTEAQKIVSALYEDLQTQKIAGEVGESSPLRYNAKNQVYKDGDYEIYVAVESNIIRHVCITDGTNGYEGGDEDTIDLSSGEGKLKISNGNSLDFTANYTTGKSCEGGLLQN